MRPNDTRKDNLKSISKQLGHCLINHSTRGYGPIHLQIERIINFRNKDSKGHVNLYRDVLICKNILNKTTNRGPNDRPLRLIKQHMKSIHSRGYQWFHTENSRADSIIIYRCLEHMKHICAYRRETTCEGIRMKVRRLRSVQSREKFNSVLLSVFTIV